MNKNMMATGPADIWMAVPCAAAKKCNETAVWRAESYGYLSRADSAFALNSGEVLASDW